MVGLIILVIITVPIVATNGAGRIAGSRPLYPDALPGKQMSIDADFNAGLINEEGRRRRKEAGR